jgi:small subunit ribosomal protein S8
MNDSVADFLTRIRNAIKADHDDVLIPSSKLNRELARLLKQEGYIEDFSIEQLRRQAGSHPSRAEFETIRVKLKYTQDRDPVISGLKRVSKPGRRQYATAGELPKVQGGMGTVLITTSSGVMTAYEARRKGVGGEVVAYVW